jgi:hypothetical protein
MPFDHAEFTKIYNTPRDRLQLLINELRKPQPNWDFRWCETCAIGLAWRLFPEANKQGAYQLSQFFGVDFLTLHKIFGSPKKYGHNQHKDVQSEEVADALEHLLCNRPSQQGKGDPKH